MFTAWSARWAPVVVKGIVGIVVLNLLLCCRSICSCRVVVPLGVGCAPRNLVESVGCRWCRISVVYVDLMLIVASEIGDMCGSPSSSKVHQKSTTELLLRLSFPPVAFTSPSHRDKFVSSVWANCLNSTPSPASRMMVVSSMKLLALVVMWIVFVGFVISHNFPRSVKPSVMPLLTITHLVGESPAPCPEPCIGLVAVGLLNWSDTPCAVMMRYFVLFCTLV